MISRRNVNTLNIKWEIFIWSCHHDIGFPQHRLPVQKVAVSNVENSSVMKLTLLGMNLGWHRMTSTIFHEDEWVSEMEQVHECAKLHNFTVADYWRELVKCAACFPLAVWTANMRIEGCIASCKLLSKWHTKDPRYRRRWYNPSVWFSDISKTVHQSKFGCTDSEIGELKVALWGSTNTWISCQMKWRKFIWRHTIESSLVV